MANGIFGIPLGTLVFSGTSALVLGLSILALQQQTRYIEIIPVHFEQLTKKEWQQENNKVSSSSPLLLGFGLFVAVILVVYPFFYQILPVQPPYLVRTVPQYGVELQAVIGVVFWTPSVVLTAKGLYEAQKFSKQFRNRLRSIDSDVDLRNDVDEVRGLLGTVPSSLFRSLQIPLLLWGLVAGLGVGLVFFAREEIAIIVVVTLIVISFLSYIFIFPLLTVTRWIAARSDAIQAKLQDQLIEARLETVALSIGGHSSNPEYDTSVSSMELDDVINALPPSNAWELLWEQILQTVVAMLGPSISIVVKLLQAL